MAAAARTGGRSLLGRDRELEHLYATIDQIGRRGGALIVHGEAGIGKSALLDAAADRARELGATVVTTTGTQSEARFAFGGLHQLLLGFRDDLDRLPDPQRRALDIAFGVTEGEAPDVFLVGPATLGVFTEREEQPPLLLVVDDAHDHPLRRSLALDRHEHRSPLPETQCQRPTGRRRPAPHLRRGARLRGEPLRSPGRPRATG